MAESTKLIKACPKLKPREYGSHKGSYGRGLVIGGCQGMAGAAAMCADAALRSGAGLVTAGVPRGMLPVLAAKTTCPTTMGFAETREHCFAAHALLEVERILPEYTAVAVGPGIGTHPSTRWFVLNLIRKLTQPAVIDADALNNLATDMDALREHKAPLILTPHPGEMSRLTQLPTGAVQRNRRDLAEQFAARHGVIVVLKGHDSVVTDGARTWINNTGNPGMATGGSGDVLTGVILGLLCQGMPAFEAAQLGTRIHGLAGDIAEDLFGEVSMIATDILNSLPGAFMYRA